MKIRIIPDEQHVQEIKELYGKEIEAELTARIHENGRTWVLGKDEFEIIPTPLKEMKAK